MTNRTTVLRYGSRFRPIRRAVNGVGVRAKDSRDMVISLFYCNGLSFQGSVIRLRKLFCPTMLLCVLFSEGRAVERGGVVHTVVKARVLV